MNQIVSNVLANAVKFTPAGGSVKIAARAAANGGIAVEVVDTGIGMNANDLEKALSPFGQIDSSLSRRFEGDGSRLADRQEEQPRKLAAR